MLPIALALYSVREDAQTDLSATLRKVKALGYEGVEFAGLHGHSPAAVKQMLEDTGLAPVSAHVMYDELIQDPERVMRDYQKIGCRYIAIPYMAPAYRMNGEKTDEALAGIRRIAEAACTHGLTLLYHNHEFEFEMIDGVYALDLLYRALPPDLLQVQLDTCWSTAAGIDSPAYLRKYAGRAPVVHLKDFFMEGGSAAGAYDLIGIQADPAIDRSRFEFRALGSGQQNFPAILAAAKDAGSKWLVVEQDEPMPGKTALECAELSLNYLKGLKL
jgi:sugar phosphate isomerase/epimerase